MRKTMVMALGACMLLSSCVTTSDGAFTGGSFGSILGSAIGGLLGGPRGSDIGTIVGMAGGAAAGAAVGNATEKKAIREHYARVEQSKAAGVNTYGSTGSALVSDGNALVSDGDESGFDPNGSGDDRLYEFTPSTETADVTSAPSVEIRNVRFEDTSKDGVLRRGEIGTLSFEVINRSSYPLDNLQPTVIETTGNRHVAISSSIRVERIMPGEGIRYTATVRASNRVKDGTVCFVPTVSQGSAVIGQAASVNVPTTR